MFRLFSTLSVRAQLLSLMFVLVSLVLFFASITVHAQWSKYKENEELTQVGALATKASALVHEFQKERGMTAGFLKSSGAKFSAELPKQREEAGARLKDYLEFIETSNVASLNSDLAEVLNEVRSDLDRVPEVRDQVSTMSIPAKDAVAFYTNLNGKLFSILSVAEHIATDAHVLLELDAFVNFLQGKERAGIERAVGAGGFGSKFSAVDIEKLNALVVTQNVYFSVFKSIATKEHIEFVKQTLDAPAVAEVERMRGIARQSVATGDLQGIDAGYWFKTITEKINLLKIIENKLSEDLMHLVQKNRDDAWSSFVTTIVVTAVILSVVLYLSVCFGIALSQCFQSLHDMLKRGADGQFRERITNIKSHGEMKQVLRLANKFMDQMEVFVRETAAVMKASARNEFHRTMLTKGLRGDVNKAATAMNAAVIDAGVRSGELQKMTQGLEQMVEQVTVLAGETSDLVLTMKEASQGVLQKSDDSASKSDEVEKTATVAQDNVSGVAAAVEELSASIAEISSQTSSSVEIVSSARAELKSVSETIERFGKEVEGIGNVVELIKDIAEQTNLLALNATIESARAGEAGKGFAVVANEVKSLAGQTSDATLDITTQIEAIQKGSLEIVTGIDSVNQIMEKVSEIAGTVGAAVEEQATVTQDISGNMQRTSQNVDEVKQNILSIRTALQETADSAKSMSEMTETVTGNVQKLENELKSVNG